MTNGNDPAFAISEHDIPSGQGGKIPANWIHKGLSKREYFAAIAMQGILSHSCKHGMQDLTSPDLLGKSAILAADALIKELNK